GLPKIEPNSNLQSYVEIKTPDQIQRMRETSRIARKVLDAAARVIRPGITTDEIDDVVHKASIDAGAYPSPLNYHFFPKSCCTSVNEIICHGIPDARALEDGDIVNVDVTICYNGVHGDLNETYFVGNVDDSSKKLVRATYECLEKAISIVKPGVRFREIGEVINRHASMSGLTVVKSYCGHGIGELFHCAPNIPHYGKNKAVGIMKAGQTFTIEPMINMGTWHDRLWPDGWTAVTSDGKRSAQFEHTLLVTETGVEVLTARLPTSPDVYPWLKS
ncbi:Methionine aminopeptidase 1A, partial [Zostera marina]